jgi:hypothetical protein
MEAMAGTSAASFDGQFAGAQGAIGLEDAEFVERFCQARWARA